MASHRPRLVLVGLVIGFLAACSGSPVGSSALPSGSVGGPAATAATSGDPGPLSAWDTESVNLGPDGRRSLDSALRLFAMALGPIPGVDAPSDPGVIGSLTPAVRVIRAHWSELSAAQQSAIERALTPTSAAPAVDIGPVQGSSDVPLARVRIASLVVAALTDPMITAVGTAVHDARARIAAKLGDIPGVIHVVVEDLNDASGDFADTGPTWSSGAYAGCTITVYPVATTEAAIIANTAAHEVFHCFEAAG